MCGIKISEGRRVLRDMRMKRWVSAVLSMALAITMLPMLPFTTARAADVVLEVTHSTSGDLADEISAALGGNDETPYTKVKINIGDVNLSGQYDSGDWQTLYELPEVLPNVSSLELVYTVGDHSIPDGAMSNYEDADVFQVTWLQNLDFSLAGGQLTGIGEGAFCCCIKLDSLTIPSSVTSVGGYAFFACEWLCALSLPEDGNLISIGEYAFGATGLEGTLTIPSSVTSIGKGAFGGCEGIDALSLPDDGNLNSIGGFAFIQCFDLDGTLTIPSSVTTIGDSAFSSCGGLDALSLPEDGSLSSIGSSAFSSCTGLDGTLTIPSSVTTIGDSAFSFCEGLDALSLPENSLNSIGDSVFASCTGLDGTLTIPSSVTTIGSYAFCGCEGLDSLSLPENVGLSIGDGAFSRCTELDGTLTIPSSVTTIGDSAFYYCEGLDSLSLPEDGSLSIGEDAFNYCGDLKGVVYIPSSILSIGKYAFDSTNLDALVFQNTVSAPDMMEGPIWGWMDIIAYYPASAADSYIAQSGMPSSRAGYDENTARIISFSANGIYAKIDETTKFITLDLPAETDFSSLAPEVIILGSSVNPSSGTEQNFFSGSHEYTVTSLSGSPVTYTVDARCQPVVNGDDMPLYVLGSEDDLVITANVSNSYPEDIELKACIGGIVDSSTINGDGTVTFNFPASLLNSLFPGEYFITVTAEPTAHNAAIDTTIISKPTIKMPVPTMKPATATYNSVTINWDEVSCAEKYNIYSYDPDLEKYSYCSTTTNTRYTTSAVFGTTYNFAVRSYYAGVYSDYSTICSVTPMLKPPNNLRAIDLSSEYIRISWYATAGADGYEVYSFDPDTEEYTYFGETLNTSFTDNGLNSGTTYYYVIRAYKDVDGSRMYSDYSEVVLATTTLSVPSVKVDSTGSNSIDISWGTVAGADGYQVYLFDSDTEEYTYIDNKLSTSFTHNGLISNSKYYYKVRAYKDVDEDRVYSEYSSIVSATTTVDTPTLTAKSAGYNSIKLSWNAVPGAGAYILYRSTSETGTYSIVKSATGTSYTNTGLTTGKTYYYKVRACSIVGSKVTYGSCSSVKYTKPIPATPTLSAKSAGYNSIKLSWNAVPEAGAYILYRSTSVTGTYSIVKCTTGTSYTNTGLTTGKTYYYKVRACSIVGSKVTYGSCSSVKYTKPIPATPTLSAKSAGYNSIKLSWNAVPGAGAYILYRSTSVTGTYSIVKCTTGTSYTNTRLTTGKTYYYKVRACSIVGSKVTYGSCSSIKYTKPIPATPTSVKAARASSSSIKVKWGTVRGATRYQVYRATSRTGKYTRIATTSSNSVTNKRLTKGKTYYYKVRAYHLEGSTKVYGNFSSVVYKKP